VSHGRFISASEHRAGLHGPHGMLQGHSNGRPGSPSRASAYGVHHHQDGAGAWSEKTVHIRRCPGLLYAVPGKVGAHRSCYFFGIGHPLILSAAAAAQYLQLPINGPDGATYANAETGARGRGSPIRRYTFMRAMAFIPLFAGLIFAQDRTETRTTTTTWNGTLVDAACQNSRTERTETRRETNGDRTTTTTTRTETFDCPVTTTTTTFGLVTSDGRFLRFDNPSNTRVIQIVKGNQAWTKSMGDRAPIRVRVIGTANGDVAVVESLNPDVATVAVTGNADRISSASSDFIFDVRQGSDRGKLVATEKGVNFENLSDAKHSRSWTYSQIKELKRQNGNEIKIEPFSGDSLEFRVDGQGMPEAVYQTLANRIAAARAH